MIGAHGVVWIELMLLLIAFVLSSLVGYERQVRQKSAGLRTHTLVGLGAALFMLISKDGFFDVLGEFVRLDPSRVAASIVSGIGFIGGGLIFVRRDAVRGLTTASAVWLTAAIGAAAGAGMVVVAVAVTALHFVVTVGYTRIGRGLPRPESTAGLRLSYAQGSGVLAEALMRCTARGFSVEEIRMAESEDDETGRAPVSIVSLMVHGTGSVADLVAELSELPGMRSLSLGESSESDD